MKLIGICGKAGAGKDTAANWLSRAFSLKRYAFADPLKEACAAAYKIPLHHFHQRDIKEIKNPYWQRSPREIAQYVGTELFRENVDSNFWVQRAEIEWRELDHSQGMVVPDVRFQNEADWIAGNAGLIIEIERPGLKSVGITGHKSEQGFDTSIYGDQYVRIINDSDVHDLFFKLAETCRNFK